MTTEKSNKSTTDAKTLVLKPMVLMACCGALVTFVATAVSGFEALVFASLGTLLAAFLFGMTQLIHFVLSMVSLSKDLKSPSKVVDLNLTKRMAYGMLLRGAFALSAMVIGIRFYEIDSKLAVAIALPLYCGLLLAEIASSIQQQEKCPSNLAKSSIPHQARI